MYNRSAFFIFCKSMWVVVSFIWLSREGYFLGGGGAWWGCVLKGGEGLELLFVSWVSCKIFFLISGEGEEI